jgi:hypothetical protein
MKRAMLLSAVICLLWSGEVMAQQGRYVVLFPFDQATLDPAAEATISSAADEFKRTGSAQISVKGHTDTSGNSDYNLALSERREKAVTSELLRLGVPPSALSSTAVGEADPAVQTGDNVREAQNRRVEIDVIAPPPPPPPAPTPPAPVAEAAPPAPAPTRWNFTTGIFYGYNFGDHEGTNSQFIGLNLSLDYRVNDWVSVGAEQAGFYHFDSHNDGPGGRTVIGPDFYIGDIFYVGGNIGYLYGSGLHDDWIGGPEIGMQLDFVNWKIAYDIPFDGGPDKSNINTTLGLSFKF